MNGILLPEIVIFNTLESIIALIRQDIKDKVNQNETILYKLLGVDEEGKRIKMNLYDYFKQAKRMFLAPDSLSVNFGYNQEVAKVISLHIIMPSEHGSTSIGADEGYVEGENGELYFTQIYDSTYQIMITSNNSSEVNVIYNILKSMLLMLTSHLELMGIRLPSISGNDIVMRDEFVPVPMFHKVLNLSFKYEHNVPQLVKNDILKKFYYQMRLVEK